MKETYNYICPVCGELSKLAMKVDTETNEKSFINNSICNCDYCSNYNLVCLDKSRAEYKKEYTQINGKSPKTNALLKAFIEDSYFKSHQDTIDKNKYDGRIYRMQKKYYYICPVCGDRKKDIKVNKETGVIDNKFIDEHDLICKHCSVPTVLMEKSMDEYEKEYVDLTGKYPDWETLRMIMENSYVKEHPEQYDKDARRDMLDRREQAQRDYERKMEERRTKPRCPKCDSMSIITQTKGFGVGKAVAGVLITGSVLGAAAGAAGSGKVINVCQNCGHKWRP